MEHKQWHVNTDGNVEFHRNTLFDRAIAHSLNAFLLVIVCVCGVDTIVWRSLIYADSFENTVLIQWQRRVHY